MMGFTLPHAQVPITKTVNCILAPTRNELTSSDNEMACIRCGQCAEAVRYRYYYTSYSGTRKPKNLISAKSSI